MTFTVDGSSVTATSVTATFTNGTLALGGGDTSRNITLSFALAPTPARIGTYPLGPTSPANALIMVGNPASSWQAGVGIGSGTITLDTFTTTSASGTFSFTLAAVAGTGASGTKTVSAGSFNVTFTTPTPPPGTSSSSSISVSIDGVAWSSSLSRRATLTNNILTLTGQDTNLRVITLALPVSGGLMVPPAQPVTISLNFGASPRGTVTMVLGTQNWDNGHAGGAGSVTITSISATRVTGAFSVTLVNNPINAAPVPTAQLTNGQFDMALERF